MSSNNISKNNSTIFTTKNNELAIFGQTLDDIREKLINFNDVIMQGGTFGSSKKQLIPENELTKIISNDEAKSIVDTLNSINDKTNETWDSTDSYLTFLKGKGKGYVTDYVKTNQNQVYITEDVIQASKDARAAQIAQNEAVKEGTLSFKAGQVALKGFALAGNMLLMWGVSEVISLVVTKISDYAHELDNARDAAEDAKSTLNELNTAVSDNGKWISENASKYEELADGVDSLGRNVSLTDDEFAEYNSLTNEIADMFPTLVTGYTDTGNAILSCKNNVDLLTQAYKEQKQAAQDAVFQNANDLFKGFKADTTDWNVFSNGGMSKETERSILQDMIDGNDLSSLDWRTIATVLNNAGIGTNKWVGGSDEDLKKKLEENKKTLYAYARTLDATMESATSNVTPIIDAYLDSNKDFRKYDQEVQSQIKQIADNMGYRFYAEFENTADLVDWIDNTLVPAFKDSDTQNLLNQLFSLDTDDMAVSDYVAQINDLIDKIAEAIGGDAEEIKIKLGFDFVDTDEELLNKAKRKVDDVFGTSAPTAGSANIVKDSLEPDNKKELESWLDKLNESDLQLILDGKIEFDKNTTVASAQKALDAAKKEVNENPIESLPSTDILAQVQALSDGLDQLDKIYADVYNKEDFDWSSILNNDGFKEAFGNMTNVTEEYKNAYDDFIKTISNNPSDLSACQSAFDNLATAYIYNSDALKNVTEDTKASTIAMLEQMGIANAEEVVTAQIANNLLEARAATLDFASATDADINSLVAYANQLGLTAADVAQLCLKQIDVSNNPIKTQASLANLQSLISMAGVTGDKLTYLLKMINAVNNVASLAASGKATQSQITAAGRIVENLQGQMKKISTANVKPQVSYSGGTSTKSAIDKANKSSGSSSKDSKETKETFNWVETAISRIQRAVTNLGKIVSATYKSWSTRNSALSSEMSAVTQEISVQQSAYQTYMDKANSVGLSDYYKNLVQNGGMSIEDVTDDTLKEQIQTYKEYYEKALAASDAVQDLRDNLAELAKTKFDNLAKKFENELDFIEHKSSMLDKYIDQTEKKGEIVSEYFYTTLIQNEQANVDKLQNEYNSLFNQLQDSISTGGIEVYSDDWYEMVGQINDVEEALVDANSALVDYEKSLLKLRWDNFDYLRDCISDIISETEFLADLLDNKKLFDDSGHLNNYGESLGALYAIEYNTYMNQADEYAKAIDELNKAIAANPNDKDLLDRRQELYDAQREAIKNAESEKNAIKDLISDAYDAQLEALQKLIDKRKELLDATSDLYEYENTISEKTDTIASYQKQLQAYQGDNSEEGIANRQKIQTELEKAQKDLQQTEYEKWKSDQTAMLDDLYSEYETMLNSRLDDIDALVQDVINQSNANSVEIQGTIIDVANQVGYNVSNDLQTILDTNNGMYDMVAFYNENFTGLLTTTNMSINGVTDRINAMISYSDSNAVNIINSINTAANNIVTASLQAASVYSSTIASLQSQLTLATIAANNNSSNHSGGSSGSSGSGGSSSSLKPGKTGGTIKKPHRTITSNSGATTHPMYNIATRYAKGGNVSSKTKSPFDDLAQSMGEDTMVAVKEGERILTPVQNEMWEQWTASLPKLMDLSDSIKIPDFSKNVAQNATQSNINIGIDNIQMNGVNDPEKFTKQLVESVQQNGKVQSVLKDLTSNALLGKNSLRINKY